jgi:hypothetical protein
VFRIITRRGILVGAFCFVAILATKQAHLILPE